MSYILSALKKAEQERHSGDVPDVLTPQAVEAEPPARRSPRLYFVGGVAAALLAGLWAVNVLRFDGALDGAGGESLAPRAAPAAAVPPRGTQNVSPSGASGVSLGLSRRMVPSPSPGLSPNIPPNFSPGAVQAEIGAAPASLSPAVPEGLSGDEPVFGRPGGEPGIKSGTAGAVPQWAREWPAGDVIPDLAELPPSLRKNMPPLKLTGHLYSLGHPNARKVILNGAALKEGQYLDDDLMVSEITPDGVILDFHGRLFRIGADQMFR